MSTPKKVFLGVGHGGSDPGAVGYLKEADVNLSMAKYCRDVLEDHGVKVLMSRTKDEDDDLNEETRECNAFNPDLAVDVHNNAGGGDGFEVLYSLTGGTSKILALNIESEVKKIGQNSRGCKTKVGYGGLDYFGFIRETVCPAVICEGVFVDNKADASQADTASEQKAFGVAYAKGILKTLGIAYKDTSNKNDIATLKTKVQKRFGFSDGTMKFLSGHSNPNALFDKLSAKGKGSPYEKTDDLEVLKKNVKKRYGFTDGTIKFLLNHKSPVSLFKKLSEKD